MARAEGRKGRRWWMMLVALTLALMAPLSVASAEDGMVSDEEGDDVQTECHEENTQVESECPTAGRGLFSSGRTIDLQLIGTREVELTTTKEGSFGICGTSYTTTYEKTETVTYGMYESPDGYGVEIDCYSREVTWHGPLRTEEEDWGTLSSVSY